MTDQLEVHASAQELYLQALQIHGDESEAQEAAGIDYRTMRGWAAADPSFRADRSFAMEVARQRLRRRVTARILDVVLEGDPQIQTHNGRVVLELERHPNGQVILDPQVDAQGAPMLDDNGAPVRLVPRLKLDPLTGEPIPVVMRRYDRQTTMRVAESLEILQPQEEGTGADVGKDVVLIDDSGKRISLVEALRARFEAAKRVVVVQEDSDAAAD